MKIKGLIQVLLVVAFCSSAFQALAQEAGNTQDLTQSIPVDQQITIGTLENGLKYYIRKNTRPENRAELRLVLNVGSVLEDEEQQGLAHFVEHMAFNGTANFPKQALINFIESVGMRLGADVNAYTDFDETVYFLQVPTDDNAILEQAFQIMEDWVHNVSFEAEEIEKERGVVVEEWRLGQGAAERMFDQQLPILFKDSRYAERLPIGQKAVLDTFEHETLRRFYQEWYRTDLMAVIAVGDFDPVQIQEMILQHFSSISAHTTPLDRPLFPVPDHEETLFAIASDPEATSTDVFISHKQEVRSVETLADFRQSLVEALFLGMVGQRLNELIFQPDPPFLIGGNSQSQFVRSKSLYSLAALAKPNGVEEAFESLLTEAARVLQHGFITSELIRQKEILLTGFEQGFLERDKVGSGRLANEYIRNFLTGEPIPGIEYEYEAARGLVPEISLGEVNLVGGNWITEGNRVIMVRSPEGEGVVIPTEADLLAVIEKVRGKEILSYQEDVTDSPLVETIPTPGTVVSDTTILELGITEWTLSNGVRVVLKPTDFQNNEIRFNSFSPGGHSLVPDEDYIAAITATSVIREAGLGNFSIVDLQKKLAGKIVRVSPRIGALRESISGRASPKDLETMFQLIYLNFTAPRRDSSAFLSYRNFLQGVLENASASPEAAFSDTIQVTMAQYHHRARPFSTALLAEMDLDKSFGIYTDRFADAGDFTFFFVGNFELESIKTLVETYLGGLPSTGREETWKDVGIRPPKGVIKKIVRKGIEPSSQTQIMFSGPYEWNRQNRIEMDVMAQVLDIKLREVLREELGETYGVFIRATPSHFPEEQYQVTINFGSAPENVEELTGAVFGRLDSLKKFGPTETDLAKAQEQQRRDRETSLKENGFWLNSMWAAYYHGGDLIDDILNFDQRIDGLTVEAIQLAAQRYFDFENYVRVVLHPEGFGLPLAGDFNGDGAVDFQDFLLFAQHFDQKQGDSGFDAAFDLNTDGEVGFSDFLLFAQDFGKSSGGGKPVGTMTAEILKAGSGLDSKTGPIRIYR
ncbi:MAG: insulinase family protein [bacterium]|nr:insulinase family protein [bacterium]